VIGSRERETAIGAMVLLVGLAVLGVSYGASSRAKLEGYDLQARFNKADGISVGSDLRLSGLSIGKVVAQGLDDRFRAVLTLRLQPGITIPTDSSAIIQTDGLMGAKFVAIQPGGEDEVLKPGQMFQSTQDSVNVQDLLEQIIAQGEARREKQQQGGSAP